ncbi:MAG: helix-turn-helix transcriptional regulator [Rhodospirillaceae bacterium]|nr:helix-turn-helix transcriptional regulator [Rhodospirillaceae bacterium]
MARRQRIVYDSENAFAAMGLADAADLRLRADLMDAIGHAIASRNLTQRVAASLMGMDQPRVSALLNGRITKFSTERLLRALADLGLDVEVRLKARRKGRGRIRLAA